MKLFSQLILVLFILMPVRAYNTHSNSENKTAGITRKVSEISPEQRHEEALFNNKIEILYNAIAAPGLSYEAFRTAATGYFKLKEQKMLANDSLLSIVDFSQTSIHKRFYIINMKNVGLVHQTYVAHGTNTGVFNASEFSNRMGSNQSSLGFFLTNEIYMGRQGISLKLDGLEEKFNSNARPRGVVIHGADYVSESFIQTSGRLGRSFGCPAVPMDENLMIIETIKHRSCFYIYHPNKDYLSKSELLNAPLHTQS